MSTLLTRMFSRPRALCARCQVNQGRNCQCLRARKVRRPRISDTAWLWLLIAFDVACLLAVGWLAALAWRAWA